MGLVSCVVGVWLGCINVIPTTGRESATPDSKENKQAGRRGGRPKKFSNAFSLPRVVVSCSPAEREGLFTHTCTAEMFKRTLFYCAASCVTKDLPVSPRISPTIFYRDANSVLLHAPLYCSRLYAQNPVFEIVHPESVKV